MKTEPVYIVSSFHRSGSSMMMRCLEAGGLEAVYDASLDRLWNHIGGSEDYKPNPNGFYHIEDRQTDWPTFYKDHAGKLIKVPRAGLSWCVAGRYKLIFMVRDPREIQASMHKFSPNQSWGQMESNLYFYDMIKKATLDELRARGDFEILEVQYKDVVANPTEAFENIKAFGFPIEVQKAAEMVDPSLYRLKLEKI
jgi:hypothetical protein